jgi:hypothetical protein
MKGLRELGPIWRRPIQGQESVFFKECQVTIYFVDSKHFERKGRCIFPLEWKKSTFFLSTADFVNTTPCGNNYSRSVLICTTFFGPFSWKTIDTSLIDISLNIRYAWVRSGNDPHIMPSWTSSLTSPLLSLWHQNSHSVKIYTSISKHMSWLTIFI